MSLLRTSFVIMGLLATSPVMAQVQGFYRAPASADGYLGLRVASNFGVYGKLGAAAMRPPATVLATPADATSAGVSYSIGVSWEFRPRLAATVGWDTYDLRLLGSDRDAVRGPSLGLQWRY